MSITVITWYDGLAMGRWEPDARGRLRRSALELFEERGFDGTTVSEIAKRAGLTERTFFRQFSDKREVLFAGGNSLERVLAGAIEQAPAVTPPLECVALGLDAVAAEIPTDRGYARRRSAVIEANPELAERERHKFASLAAAAIAALRTRGVKDSVALLASEAGMAVFRSAFATWLNETGERSLTDNIRDALDELRSVTA